MHVNVTKLRNRRAVELKGLDMLLREAQTLARMADPALAGGSRFLADEKADRPGSSLSHLGNADLAATLEHLARSVRISLDPLGLQAPFLLRLMVRLLKKNLLSKPLPVGNRPPGRIEQALWPAEPVGVGDALAHLEAQVARFKQANSFAESPVFGPLTRDEWIALHCRHAESHFSFFIPPRS